MILGWITSLRIIGRVLPNLAGFPRPLTSSYSPAALRPPGNHLNSSTDVGKHFLVVDNRFGTPIHVFLELDPSAEPGFPNFGVRAVTLEPPADAPDLGVPAGVAIGRNPHQLNQFRAFGSDKEVAGAGYILIEPRYVGPSWPAYVLAFRPGGEKPMGRPASDHHVEYSKR